MLESHNIYSRRKILVCCGFESVVYLWFYFIFLCYLFSVSLLLKIRKSKNLSKIVFKCRVYLNFFIFFFLFNFFPATAFHNFFFFFTFLYNCND